MQRVQQRLSALGYWLGTADGEYGDLTRQAVMAPYPASHGCVRVSNAAMNMIWSTGLMPMGRTVLVY